MTNTTKVNAEVLGLIIERAQVFEFQPYQLKRVLEADGNSHPEEAVSTKADFSIYMQRERLTIPQLLIKLVNSKFLDGNSSMAFNKFYCAENQNADSQTIDIISFIFNDGDEIKLIDFVALDNPIKEIEILTLHNICEYIEKLRRLTFEDIMYQYSDLEPNNENELEKSNEEIVSSDSDEDIKTLLDVAKFIAGSIGETSEEKSNKELFDLMTNVFEAIVKK